MNYFGLLKDYTDKKIKIKGKTKADLVSCGENSIIVLFPKEKNNLEKATAVALVDDNNEYLWINGSVSIKETTVISFDSFEYSKTDAGIKKFKLYLVFEEKNTIILSRLYSEKVERNFCKTKDISFLYYDVISENERFDKKSNQYQKHSSMVNIASNGLFGLLVFPTEKLIHYRVRNYITKFEIEDDCYYLEFKIKKYMDAEVSLKLRYCYKGKKNIYVNLIEDSLIEENDYYIFKCRINKNFSSESSDVVYNIISCYTINDENLYVIPVFDNSIINKAKKDCLFNISTENSNPAQLLSRVVDDSKLELYSIIPVSNVDKSDFNNTEDYVYNLQKSPSRELNSQFYYNDEGFNISLEFNTSELDNICFFAFHNSSSEKIILSSDKNSKNDFTVDLSEMKKAITKNNLVKEYLLCVAFIYRDKYYSLKLKSFKNSIRYTGKEKYKNFVPDFNNDIITLTDEEGTKYTSIPMYNRGGNILLKTGVRSIISKSYVSVPYVSHNIRKNILKITADVTDSKYEFKKYVLSYRYKKSEDRQFCYIEGSTSYKNGRKIFEGAFDLTKCSLKRIIWDVYAVFSISDREYFAKIVATEKQINDSFYCKKSHYQIGNDVFFSYFTENKTLAFILREKGEMDTLLFGIKEKISLFTAKVLKSYYKKKRIILTYEKNCNCAQDNGYVFFKKSMDKNYQDYLNAEIYYVIDKKSPDYNKVEPYRKNVIDFLSIRHMVYILVSSLLVSSDSKVHLYGWRPNSSIIAKKIREKKYVFLQHGVLGLKRVDSVFGKGKQNEADAFITSSESEKNIVINQFNYPEEKVYITGLARWDDLVDKSENSREILLMPTFRIWLDEATEKDFLKSDYYNTYKSLLESERLYDLLKENNLTLNFYMHPRFSRYIKNFAIKNERIKIILYGEEPVNELMMRCKLLITDYSSVCWDVFYMGKPVLFYQFDYELYSKIHGSYIDMKNNLFGERCENAEDLLTNFENSIKNKFKLSASQKKIRNKSFAYIDSENTSRIVEIIKNMEW